MNQPAGNLRRTRAAVRRPSAENLIFISLLAFGLTVVVTRVFLILTGYPQIGNSVLHIAHALWGGLLLFAAVLVTLILVNRWAFNISAALSGIGVGLFIDEIGKFITQKNDYFFAPAAPLIYSLFLLLALVFLLLRRSRQGSPRTSMYRALLGLQEALDNDLDPVERDHLLADLANGRDAAEPHVAALAGLLAAYLQDEALPLTRYHPGWGARLSRGARALGERLGRKNHHRLIVGITAVLGINALLVVALLVWAWLSPQAGLEILTTLLLTATELTIQRPIWLVVRLALQLSVGLLYFWALIRLGQGREEAGLNVAIIAALLSLTGVHLLTFYLNQFGSLAALFTNLALFLLLLAYRSWYLGDDPAGE